MSFSPRTILIQILVVFTAVAAAAQSPSDAASPGYAFPQRSAWQRHEKAFAGMIKGNDAAGSILQSLRNSKSQDELYDKLIGLGYALDKNKRPLLAGEMFDRLMQKGDPESTLLATDILFWTVSGTKDNPFGISKEIIRFPDELCDRAASLLDHPDPLIEAYAEWALALRVKKQNTMTVRLGDLITPDTCQKEWFQRWFARKAQNNLTDDYFRQLIQLNRHRTPASLALEADRIEQRITRMLDDPDSDKQQASGKKATFQSALKAFRRAVEAEDLPAAHKAYPALRLAAREVIIAARSEFPVEGIAFMTSYKIPGGDWNVNVPVTDNCNGPGGDLYTKMSADPAAPANAFGLQKKMGGGSIRGIDLTWEADRILFSYWHQPVRPDNSYGWDNKKNAHLYETELDGKTVTQLTHSPGDNDIEPCYLPDGGVIFASDRSSFGNQCAGPFIQDKRCTTLFRIDPRRGDQPVAISNNKDFDRYPHILNDGTVVFMHWEYQERDLYQLQTAWRCRPDGTNMDAFYKQHIGVPYSIRGVQQVPGSQICVSTAQGHHDAEDGPIILFNPSLGINNADTMQLVTPNVSPVEGGLGPLEQQIVPEGGVENRGGSYISPFPLSEKAFLAGHDMEGISIYQYSRGQTEFAIYYVDVWGNRELIHRDKEMSCFMPHPLRQRKRPPVVADTVVPDATYATAFVEDVYRDLPGVEKGAVKYLRLSQRLMLPAPVDYEDPNYDFNHLHWFPGDSTGRHFGYWTFAPTRTIGFVKVEDDGSAYFKVPAGTPVYLQALDENHCEIRRMRTSFTLQRGEFRGCTGCHESRLTAVGTQPVYPRETLDKGPQTPVPPAWGDLTVQDYRRDIQPIFDRHCISCHGEQNPKGGLDLTGRPAAGFTQSYRSLFGLKPQDPQPINDIDIHLDLYPETKDFEYITRKAGVQLIDQMQKNQYPGMLVSISDKNDRSADVTQPYQFGSNKSRLIRVLLDDSMHRTKIKPELSDEEWLQLVTWIDHNANFHSTLMDKSRYQKQKTVTRIPYFLPDPWIPADLNPSFYNTKDTSIVPKMAVK